MANESMRLSMLIQANAAQAKAEVTSLKATVDQTKASVQELGTGAGKGAAGVDALGDKAGASEAQIAALNSELASLRTRLESLSSSEAQAIARMGELTAKVQQLEAAIGRGGRGGGTGAAGSMGNLVANFNDVGVMMAAGQNPLTLAIQQGTQITQVIGPMGAAGAFRAMGGAVLAMLSPMNLAVIGGLALGAATIQWLTGANEAAETFDDTLDDVEASIKALNAIAGQTSAEGLAALEERYGRITAKVRELIEAQNQLTQIDAMDNMQAALSAIDERLNDGYFGNGVAENTGALIGVQFQRGLGVSEGANAEITAFMERLENLGRIEGFGAQADEAAALRQEIERAAGGIANMSDLQRGVYRELTLAEDAARALARASGEVPPAVGAAADEAAVLRNNAQAAAGMGSILADRFTRTAQATAAAEARAAAYEASLLRARTAGELVYAEIWDAKTATEMLAGAAPGAGWLDGAIGAAATLAYNLWDAVTAYNTFATSTPAAGGPAGAPAAVAVTGFRGERTEPQGAKFSGGGSGGGDTGPSQAERDAAKDLIQSLKDEIAILQELDPVQQEMLRHREDLALATTAERAEIETLIATRIREEAAAESQREIWDTLKQTSYDVIKGLEDRGRSAMDVMRSLGLTILDVVQKGLLLGEGPLGALLGGGDDGGLLGMIGNAVLGSFAGPALGVTGSGPIGGRAGGGPIWGEGTGTSDSILVMASHGEHIMTAAASAQYRPVLDAMNAGAPIPAFARGGAVGGGSGGGGSGGGSSGRGSFNVTLNFEGARGDREIEEIGYRGMQRALDERLSHYNDEILPVRMRDLSSDWRTG